jgi:hypothetical protein
MLKKLVNGEEVVLTEQEERQQRAYWDLNTKYPEYRGHCGWDGVNEPFHDMIECKKHHCRLLDEASQQAISEINAQIETAQENGEPFMHLLQLRKQFKELAKMDLSQYEDIESLKNSVPQELIPSWNKWWNKQR